MNKIQFTRQILQVAFDAHQKALNQPPMRTVRDVFTTFYQVLDEYGYEKMDAVLRKSFPELYWPDGRTKANLDHYKLEPQPRGGTFLTQMSDKEIANLYQPKSY